MVEVVVEVEWTAREIVAFREALRLSRPEFARRIGVTTRTLTWWENGQTEGMHAASRRLLHNALATADADAVGRFKRSLTGGATNPVVRNPTAEVEEVIEDMRRREILAYLGVGVGVAGQLAEQLVSEPDRMLSAIDATSISERRLACLEQAVTGLGRRVVQKPPHTLVDETLAYFQSVRGCLEGRLSTHHRVRLVRAAGRLANVMGEILFNQGRFAAARQWYETSIHAARDIGDLYSEDIALAGLSYLPTYSDEPGEVLDTLAVRLDQNPDEGPAVAWLWGMAARAHASLGDADQFAACIEKASRALERSTPDQIETGIFSFRPEKLAFYEAIGHSRLQRADATADAARRAIALYDPQETMEPALVQLEYATALLSSGEVEEACVTATRAVTDTRTFLGAVVTGRAVQFDAALSDVRGRAVADWRQHALPALEAAQAKVEPGTSV
jgi:transcriptional regulator with XRE-family HTH domain